MKSGKLFISIGIASLIIAIISRVLVKPVPPIGLEASALVQFANACFLLSIAVSLSQCKK